MDNEEKKLPPKDNLLEEIGVATALGGSGAALFLHEGSLEHVDKYFRKAKIYKDEIGNFIRNNIDDITQIDSDSITALRNSIDTKLTKYQSTSLSYHPTDDRVLNGLYESFNIKLNSRKELRKLYKNEVKRIAQSSINRYSEELSQEVYDALISNLDAFTSDDNDEILKRLNKRLGAQNFYLASRVANYVIDDVEEWKGIEGNDEKTWIGKRRKEFVETLSDDFFNVDELLKRQNKKNKSIIEKTRRDSHLTLGEVIDTLNADFDSQKSKQLRELLSRDKVLSLDRYSYIEGLKFGEQDTKIFSKIKKIMEDNKDTPEEKAEKISAYLGDTFGTLKQTVKDGELRSSIVLSTLDLIRLQHNALEGDKEKLEAFRSLELDEIFTNKETGNIYTTSDIKKGLRGAVSSLSEYMPIRMLRLGDLEWQDRAEKLYHIFDIGDVDSVLAQELGSGDEFINNHVYAANGKMYVVEDGHFSKRTELENLRDAKIVDNKTGLYKKIAEANSRSKPYPRKQGLLGLAFFKDEDLVDKEADKGLFKKFGAETISKLNALEETFMESSIDSIEAYRKILGVVNDFDDFNRILNETTSLPDINGLKRIYNVVDQSSDGAKFLRYIFELEDNPNNLQEIMESLNHLDNDTGLMETRNPYLAMTIQRYNNDPVGVRRTFINTKEDTYGRDSSSYSSKTYKQTLQQELATEFFLRYSDNPNNNVFQLLEGKFDTYEKKRAAESLVATRLFFERLGVTQEASVIGRFSLLKNGLEDIITSNDAESEKIKEIIANHFIRFGKDAEKMSVKDQEFLNTPAKSVLRKTYLPSKQIGLDLITMINNQQFSKAFDLAAETGFNFVSQFFAGDDMPSNKTAASSLAHFIFNKVQGEMTWDFSIGGFRLANYHLDLRLDPNDTKSSYSIIKNFGKKRILPVMGLFGAYEVLDDFYKATTNMGLGEGLMSGGANAYLGLKKVTGFLGADSVIDSFAKDNVIINYYNEFFGDDSEGWNTYEEQKKYYESGYTPIRKGRFWWWGSSNEFRGGKISYWEPNSLRSLHSDYKDMSLYNGSYWLKYNPERLFNPYYLEELHSEDRPYPISGPMFEQFTPWGIMLNSTVGEILKPKRLLHSDRLSADGVDVKALIYHMNSQIREKAIENNNLFYLQGGQLRSMAFQAYNAPTYSERIITVDPEEESIQANDYGYYNTPVSINNELYQGILESNYRFDLQNKDITFQDQVAIEAAKGNELAQIARLMTNNTGLNLIKAENNKILAKAGYDKSQGMMIEQKLNSQSGAVEDMLNDSEHIAELLQAGKGSDYIHEMAVSTRMITGLYGWGFSKITGIGENNQDRIATSANMDSMSREFWDMNLGGLGGNVMEIGRRFIPEYKRFQTYNPLMNTMPDWLPERFRFGDPFCVSSDTLVELNNLQFVEAVEIQEKNNVLTHKGKNKKIKRKIERKVRSTEKVYKLKIASICAIESKFSEDHPILTCRKTKSKRSTHALRSVKRYEEANLVLEALAKGITRKKDLAKYANSNIDNICAVFKILYNHDLIENYKDDKYNITLKKYKLFDIEMLKRDLEWIKVKDLKIGDYVAYPLPEYKEKEIVLDLRDYIPLKYLSSEKYIYISGTLKNPQFIEIFEWAEKNGIPVFKRGERKNFLEEKKWDGHTYESVQYFIKNNLVPERIPRYIKLNKEIFYSFGFFMAEGWSENSGIGLAIHKDEEFRVKRTYEGFAQFFPNLTYTFKRIENTNGAQAYFGGKYLSYIMYNIFGKGAKYKKIPEFFWNASKECLLSFFEGYFDGDGCNFVTTSGIDKSLSERVSVSSCNLILLLQIRKLFLRFGLVGNIIKKPAYNTNNKLKIKSGLNYQLTLRGKQAEKAAELIWGYKENTNSAQKRRSACHTFIDNGYVYMRIMDVSEVKDVTIVWGFEIFEDKSFCTAGLATHNTSIPQGEARLPGYGYESLNQLHPDNYGRYGAFDRFKILADIAPFSPEYKFWKQVASKTITDPALKAEMDEIKERVKKQSKQHDFQDYKYVGRDVERRNVYVTEVTKNGQFKVFGSDETFKLAGVRVKANPNETGDQVLARYLQPGQLVQLVVDANEAYGRNKDTNNTINAAVIIDGESIGEQMLANGDAVERENDISVAATIARHGSFVNTINWLSEGIAHLNIPIIHNRFLRINSPLEDYKDEYLYGSSFQSWDDFYGTYIVPNMRIASDSSFFTGAGILVDILRNNFVKDTKNNLLSDLIEEYVKEDGPLKRLRTITQDDLNSRTMKFAKRAIYYSDRGGLMGSLIGKVVTLGSSDSQKLRATVFRRAGSAATLLYSATQAPENLGVSMMSWSRLAYLFSNEFMGGKKRMLAAGAGALFGLARWGGSINLLSDDSYNGTYIPDSARERWEMQDYFDRLTYIKYMSLYERAAEKAFDEEGVDIKRILERQEEETINIKESKEELKQYLRELDGKNTQEAQEMKELLKGRLNSLTGSKVPLSGGDYTKSAIMYYNAAKATMYALDENSSMADIVRALPKTDREYFMEFLKERDEEKRKEILSTVSPQIAKALRMMWYKEYNDPESNESFFTRHTLPPPSWSGWNPQVDLADVQAKVIQNEGMTFSDFGIYSSQYRDPNVINAPDLEYNANDSLIETTLKMQALLNGFGFSDVNINVEPSEDSTLQVIANVARVIEYNIGESISNIFSGE